MSERCKGAPGVLLKLTIPVMSRPSYRRLLMTADDPLSRALDRIADLEAELAGLKRWVNQGDQLIGAPPRFGDVNAAAPSSKAATNTRNNKLTWKPGEFFNKPLAAAVRMILAARHEYAGEASPASVD